MASWGPAAIPSVLVSGQARVMTAPAELKVAAGLGITPWAGRGQGHLHQDFPPRHHGAPDPGGRLTQ